MKCAQCGTRYRADYAQPAPGGSSAPGILLGFTVVLVSLTVLAFVLNGGHWKWVGLGISVLVALQVPFARAACRAKAGLAKHGGGTCPECGVENPVRLWSL